MSSAPLSAGQPRRRPLRRYRCLIVGLLAFVVVLAVNVPTVGVTLANWYHRSQVTRPAYEAKYGLWNRLSIPAKFRVNGIHSTLLYNGDVLIMAGSGNDQDFFNAGTFKTLLLNPVTMQEKLIRLSATPPTPSRRPSTRRSTSTTRRTCSPGRARASNRRHRWRTSATAT